MLCYLNPNWRKSAGGQLRLTLEGGQLVDVFPEAGRLAMFLSKTVAHEVWGGLHASVVWVMVDMGLPWWGPTRC